jgi:hypothetical protein
VVEPGQRRVDVVGEPKIDRYLGSNVVEIEIKDLRIRTGPSIRA